MGFFTPAEFEIKGCCCCCWCCCCCCWCCCASTQNGDSLKLKKEAPKWVLARFKIDLGSDIEHKKQNNLRGFESWPEVQAIRGLGRQTRPRDVTVVLCKISSSSSSKSESFCDDRLTNLFRFAADRIGRRFSRSDELLWSERSSW